jgi:hypothetical protein
MNQIRLAGIVARIIRAVATDQQVIQPITIHISSTIYRVRSPVTATKVSFIVCTMVAILTRRLRPIGPQALFTDELPVRVGQRDVSGCPKAGTQDEVGLSSISTAIVIPVCTDQDIALPITIDVSSAGDIAASAIITALSSE